jgi:hypothetical protein
LHYVFFIIVRKKAVRPEADTEKRLADVTKKLTDQAVTTGK